MLHHERPEFIGEIIRVDFNHALPTVMHQPIYMKMDCIGYGSAIGISVWAK